MARTTKTKPAGTAKTKRNKAKERIRGYVMDCASETCVDFVRIQENIRDSVIHPRRHPLSLKRRAELNVLVTEKLKYLAKLCSDLDEIK